MSYQVREVRRLEWGMLTDARRAAEVIADAFIDLGPTRWLCPDRRRRELFLADYFFLAVDEAMRGGAAYVTADGDVALWFPVTPGLPPEPDPGYRDRLENVVGADLLRTFLAFDETRAKAHDTITVPHDYLAILAVHPERQRRGIGTALIGPYLQMLDAQDDGQGGKGQPSYLEAADPDLVAYYQRFGYHELDKPANGPGRIEFPNGSAMVPMWRPAGG